jgi:hypothetical protein
MAVGLTTPTEGTLTVLDGQPAGLPDALDQVFGGSVVSMSVTVAGERRVRGQGDVLRDALVPAILWGLGPAQTGRSREPCR